MAKPESKEINHGKMDLDGAQSAACCTACRALVGQSSRHQPHNLLLQAGAVTAPSEFARFICRECKAELSRGAIRDGASVWEIFVMPGGQPGIPMPEKVRVNAPTAPATTDERQSVAVNPANAD
jgi:hypothetical protein